MESNKVIFWAGLFDRILQKYITQQSREQSFVASMVRQGRATCLQENLIEGLASDFLSNLLPMRIGLSEKTLINRIIQLTQKLQII